MAQAFSHFTFEKSKGQEIVVDIQGVTVTKGSGHLRLTDPQLHSKKGAKYGRADCGVKGMKAFFATHKCNDVCRQLGLTENSKV